MANRHRRHKPCVDLSRDVQPPRPARPSYTSSEAWKDLCTCPICLEIIDGAAVTKCGHRFCKSCLDQWLKKKKECPSCQENDIAEQLVKDYTFDQIIDEFRSTNEKLTEYKSLMVKLEQECRDLKTELQHLQEKVIPQKNTLIKDLISNHDEDGRKSKHLDEEIRRLRSYEQLCRDKDIELKRINNEVIPNKQAQLDTLGSCLLKLQDSDAAQQAEIERLRSKLKSLEPELARSLEEHKQTLNDKGRLLANNEALTDQIETLRSKEKSIELKFSRRTEEHRQLSDYNRRILDEIQSKHEDLAKLQSCTENQAKECETLRKKLKHLEEELIPEKDAHIGEILQQNADLQSELQSQGQELTQIRTYRDNLKQRCQTLWTESQQKEQAMSYKNTNLQNDLQSKCEELADLKQQCIKMRTELQRLKDEVIPNKNTVIQKIRQHNAFTEITKLSFMFVVCLGFCFGFLPFCFGEPLALFLLFNRTSF